MGAWWQRFKDRVAGWFQREPAPGRFEPGSILDARLGRHRADRVAESRLSRLRTERRAAMAAGAAGRAHSRLQADSRGHRARHAHRRVRGPRGMRRAAAFAEGVGESLGCWNWFDRAHLGGQGEAAIVAAQIRDACGARYRIDRKRVFVAGMSAGGALAAILGVRFPRLVSAVAVHSGIACGAARSGIDRIRASLSEGPEQDVEAIARCRAQRRRAARPARAAARDPRRRATKSSHRPRDGARAPIPAPQRRRSRATRRRRGTAVAHARRTRGGRARMAARRRLVVRMSKCRDSVTLGPAGTQAAIQRQRAAGCNGIARHVLRRCFILTFGRSEKTMAVLGMNHFTS